MNLFVAKIDILDTHLNNKTMEINIKTQKSRYDLGMYKQMFHSFCYPLNTSLSRVCKYHIFKLTINSKLKHIVLKMKIL